jgi:hypothetical protein
MTTHNAIKESIKEIATRVAGCSNNDKNEHLKGVMHFIEVTPAGPDFNKKVIEYLQPVSSSIAAKDIVSISNHHPNYGITELYDNMAESDINIMWQQLSMTNMLLTTMNMIPDEMLSKIETMTNAMMGVLQPGMGSGSAPDLSSLAQGLTSMMAPDQPPPKTMSRREQNRKQTTKKDEFRNKLC